MRLELSDVSTERRRPGKTFQVESVAAHADGHREVEAALEQRFEAVSSTTPRANASKRTGKDRGPYRWAPAIVVLSSASATSPAGIALSDHIVQVKRIEPGHQYPCAPRTGKRPD